jgi:hypothetical protein
MGNPAMILQMLAGAGRSGAGAPPGGSPAQAAVGPAVKELESLNPGYALERIKAIKQELLEMIRVYSLKDPDAARALMSSFKGFDSAIKSLNKAQQTLQAVGGPVQMSAVPRPQPPDGTAAAGPMNPANAGM